MAQALLSLGSNIDPVANLRVAAARRKRLRREARMRQANSAPVCKPNEEPAAAPPRRTAQARLPESATKAIAAPPAQTDVSVIEHSEPARIAAANDAALLEVRLRSKGQLAERQTRLWHKHQVKVR